MQQILQLISHFSQALELQTTQIFILCISHLSTIFSYFYFFDGYFFIDLYSISTQNNFLNFPVPLILCSMKKHEESDQLYAVSEYNQNECHVPIRVIVMFYLRFQQMPNYRNHHHNQDNYVEFVISFFQEASLAKIPDDPILPNFYKSKARQKAATIQRKDADYKLLKKHNTRTTEVMRSCKMMKHPQHKEVRTETQR